MARKTPPNGAPHDPAEWPSRQEPPRLEPAEVHLWSVPLGFTPREQAVFRPLLSEDELARSRRLVSPDTRARFASGRGALRLLLGAYIGVSPAAVTFGRSCTGKPYLEGLRQLRFSLAHSETLALVAISGDVELGVDVELRRAVPDAAALAARYFAAEEARALAALPSGAHSDTFLRYWTIKEAVLKATGEGLLRALDSFRVTAGLDEPATLVVFGGPHGPADAWTLHEFAPAPGYLGALAVKSPTCRVRRFTLRLAA
jgi:4'-phosphopantetheinyl transferase